MQPVSHIIKEKSGPDDPELAETLQQAMSEVSTAELAAMTADLAARQQRFQAWRQQADLAAPLPPEDLGWLARACTSTQKSADTLAAYLDGLSLARLLHDQAPPAQRIAAWVEDAHDLDPRLALEFASGLLHLAAPAENWLWTRWLWDVQTQTGILPLLAGSTQNLLAQDYADGYVRVGAVTAMAMRFAEGVPAFTGLLTAELRPPSHGALASDAFLAAAYSVYLYGITSWRLSREYNRLLPTLPNMTRRLLGLPKN